jgi:hypothetical protein
MAGLSHGLLKTVPLQAACEKAMVKSETAVSVLNSRTTVAEAPWAIAQDPVKVLFPELSPGLPVQMVLVGGAKVTLCRRRFVGHDIWMDERVSESPELLEIVHVIGSPGIPL